jgi:hypothetical protein
MAQMVNEIEKDKKKLLILIFGLNGLSRLRSL